MSKSNPAVVLFSFFPWDHPYPSTAHGLAKALSAHTDVFFVSKPPTMKDVFTGHRSKHLEEKRVAFKPYCKAMQKGKGGTLFRIELSPTLPINSLPPGAVYEFARARVDGRLNAQLGSLLAKQGVQDFVWINLYAPTQFRDLNLHRAPLKRIYYSVDALRVVDYTARHGIHAEGDQAAKSDLVLCTAQALAESFKDRVRPGTPVRVLPNAMDESLFLKADSLDEPADLRSIPHPRLVCIANYDPMRMDYDLLLRLAGAQTIHEAQGQNNKPAQLVLIGPWNAGEELKARFESNPNIHLLGRKNQADCAAYLAHCELGIIPFHCNELTASIYPLKINEYLSLGLPVLATPFSKDIADFEDIITLAPADRWTEVLPDCLKKQSPEERQEKIDRASENTWSARAETLLTWIAGQNVDRPNPVESL